MGANDPPLKSLFLPLREDDRAVFAAVCSLLSMGGAADSAPPAAPATVRSSSTFSPAEGGQVMEDAEEMDDWAGRGVSDGGEVLARNKSALFAVLSGRADGAVAVLASREVVFFSLSNAKRGPYEIARFAPLQSTREVRRSGDDGGAGRQRAAASSSGGATATCAALLPLELTALCRVDRKRAGGGAAAAAAGRDGSVFLRGLVGCSDGRVYVFSEHGYVFGFAAHTCPVTAVRAVYNSGGGGVEPGSPRAGSPTSAETRSLQRAMRHLGYVTVGKNGSVYVWRLHDGGSVKPTLLSGASSAHRTVALHIYQPPATSWFLSAFGGGGAQLPVEDVLSTPQAFFAVPGVRRCVRAQSLSASALAREPTQRLTDTLATGDVSDYVLPNFGLRRISAIAVDGELCALSHGCKLQVFPLSAKLHSKVPHTSHNIEEPVLVARAAITHVELREGLCVVGCGGIGLLHILRVPSFTPVAEYYTHQCRPIAGITLYPAARLITVVDAACGSVEVVQLQESAMQAARAATAARHGGAARVAETHAALPAAVKSLPTAVALRFHCEQDAILRDIGQPGHTVGAVAERLLHRQDEIHAYQEALLLASVGVSPQCAQYLHRDTFIM